MWRCVDSRASAGAPGLAVGKSCGVDAWAAPCNVQRQVSEIHKQQLQAVCALGCVHFMGMRMGGMGTDFVLPAALSSASPCLPLACAPIPVHSPSSLARVRASRRVISRASATIRASHIVAPRHLSNRTLHTLLVFQCQSDCCRLAPQCEHTRTVAGWPSSIRIDTPKQHVAVPARAVRVVGGCRSEHHRKRFARIREVFTT